VKSGGDAEEGEAGAATLSQSFYQAAEMLCSDSREIVEALAKEGSQE
jgi:hypothetical protein